MVPAADTTAVPPAATKGWYPNPSEEPTEIIIPPLGKLETPTSLPIDSTKADWVVLPEPTKEIEVIPVLSDKVKLFAPPKTWNISLTNMIAPSLLIPVILLPLDFKANSFSIPLNWSEISSKTLFL